MDELLKRIVDLINKADKKVIIGVSGHGASGKTTFAEKLTSQMVPGDVSCLNTDPYIIGSNLRNYAPIDYEYENKMHRYKMTACHPLAHQTTALERDIRMLKQGLDIYTIETHYQKSTLISSQSKVIIVEGMTVAFVDPHLFDLKIYFYTDGETELLRRGIRDVSERGTDINFIRQSHNERRIQYELFMHPYCKNFDVIIKNSNGEVVVKKINILA